MKNELGSGWFPNLIGLRLDDPVDWSEIAELIEDSYCLLAPRRLVEQLSARPCRTA